MLTTKKNTANILVYLIVFIFLFTGTLTFGTLKAKADTSVTLTGFLIDEHCLKGTNAADPGADTLGCKLMKGCIKGGYGIAVKQPDGSYQFYYADGNFFTDVTNGVGVGGTGGQKTVYDFVTAQKAKFDAGTLSKQNYLPVTVTGTLTDETKPSTQSGNIAVYRVIQLSTLRDATAQEAEALPTGQTETTIQTTAATTITTSQSVTTTQSTKPAETTIPSETQGRHDDPETGARSIPPGWLILTAFVLIGVVAFAYRVKTN
ncbi:MAG: hypothetical protein BGN88_00115 [Clostridiales bacterium 43-6]|nr:MAG: hypothetical protein BGN88_00115 [Clostridiales bacterium 43-6]